MKKTVLYTMEVLPMLLMPKAASSTMATVIYAITSSITFDSILLSKIWERIARIISMNIYNTVITWQK